MNKLVLDFLIVEGYKEGALKFIKEAGIDLAHPLNKDLLIDLKEELIDQRMQVRKYILAGSIDQAIQLINEINPLILDQNQSLHFELRKQQLIDIIKENDIPGAIAFAQEHLTPKCMPSSADQLSAQEKALSEKFMRDLEKVMTLLIFEGFS
mmetsp:Transcript_9612/g.16142  ORF Transcript_9612/g.16142 Transcript_9612/m.16142 type:complete len:152 (+) Transcript_9612:113-568(+)